jgi:HAD superfamily hydrolase (TIGR01549 family)
MIKLLIFDVNGVLYSRDEMNRYFISWYSAFLKRHGKRDKRAVYRTWDVLAPKVKRGKMTLREARKEHLTILGIDGKHLEEYDLVDETSSRLAKPIDSTEVETLRKLKEKGYKLAALSDSLHPSSRVEKTLELAGLGNIFDKVFVSAETGHPKPEKEAYELVLWSFGVKPEETVFVGHDDDEMYGARDLKIIAVSYRESRKGDFLINRFSELLALVERLNSL